MYIYSLKMCGRNKIYLFLLCISFFCITIKAQQAGHLAGQITDPLGALVVNAEVQVLEIPLESSKVKQSIKTDKNGRYRINSIKPGTYIVRVTSRDFAPFESQEIKIPDGKDLELNIQLDIKFLSESVAVDSRAELESDPSKNVDVIVLQEKNLDILPDNPDALAASLQAMAGPGAGPGGPQIFVDGYSNGKVPPKQTIREIRISQNTFSAENDRPGGGRIDIFTKPGTDKFHSSGFLNWSDSIINARNPFSTKRSPYSYKQYGGTLSGPIKVKKASFFFNLQQLDDDENGVVSARVLDNSLNPISINRSFVIPQRVFSLSSRLDYQINTNQTLTTRYSFSKTAISNLGIGELSLPEMGYDSKNSDQVFQLAEIAVLNPRTVNELRFQYIRDTGYQNDKNSTPGLIVQDAFRAGGAGVGVAFNKLNRFELQDYITTNTKNHIFRFGMRIRSLSLDDLSPSNFNGTFVFSGGNAPALDDNNQIVLDNGQPLMTQINSLERYRRTLLFQKQGLNPDQIRNLGGGASQFSLSVGNPETKINQMDFGVFFQDEWHLKPHFNIFLGLRYETQSNINDNANFAPRLSLAWTPKIHNKQNTTIRAGFGIFYQRFSEDNVLAAARFSGTQQKSFVTDNSIITDLFPNLPSEFNLANNLNAQSTTRIATNIEAAQDTLFLFSLEQKLPFKTTFVASATALRSRHAIRQRNINAPLPGTFINGRPESGIRPFGNIGEIYQIESSNDSANNQLVFGIRTQLKSNFYIFANYFLTKTMDGGSANDFPANSYDSEAEWGRGAFDVRHRFYLGGSLQIPKIKLSVSPFIVAFSSRPFNITTGIDTNGDEIFTERPSLTDSSINNINIYKTSFGNFNIDPSQNDSIITRNYGNGPGFLSVNLGISRNFGIGSAPKSTPANSSVDKPYTLTLSIQIQNLFNHVNLAAPVGNLSSPLFGQSTRTTGAYGFDISGVTNTPAYNRRVEAQIRFSF